MRKSQFHKILFLVSFWVFAAAFSVTEEGTILDYYSISLFNQDLPYNFLTNLLIATSVAFLGAIMIASFEVLFFNKLLRKKPFGVSLLIKTTFYLFSIFLLTSIYIIIRTSSNIGESIFHINVIAKYQDYLFSTRFIMVMVYWYLSVIFALFILQLSEKLGKGFLINLLLGKYYRPRKEFRIIMFLDLTSATSIAEKLTPNMYSAFLKDFFFDLDDVIYVTKGVVFQYVGDEIVIFWNKRNGIKNNNCVKFFFLAEKKFSSLKENYLKKYGVFPEFKVGLHSGNVVITEVGGRKREIAYHGDTINTTARIRSKCHEVNKRILLSAELLSLLDNVDNEFDVESVGVFNLKGKKNIIGLFNVNEKNLSTN